MHSYDDALIIAYLALVLVPAPFLGRFYYKVMEGQRTFLMPVLQPVERFCYRLSGVDVEADQSWQKYTLALLAFNLAGLSSQSPVLAIGYVRSDFNACCSFWFAQRSKQRPHRGFQAGQALH